MDIALDDATAMVIMSTYKFKIGLLKTNLHVLFDRPVSIGSQN